MILIATDPATGDKLIMPDTDAEYEALKERLGPRPNPCCQPGSPVQHWPLFEYCRGANGPGKPIRPHCTCDSCF
jgi:hypothetical protein